MKHARKRVAIASVAALSALMLGLPDTAQAADVNRALSGTGHRLVSLRRHHAATNANDGDASGALGAEWASRGQKAGAWVRVTFPEPTKINKAVLYDRPNLDDRVTGSQVRFSTAPAWAPRTCPTTAARIRSPSPPGRSPGSSSECPR